MKLNENLCILAGIHAADGHLSPRGAFCIRDEDRNKLILLAEIIRKEFGFSPKISKTNNENSYGSQFMKKEFYTFLGKNLGFPLGPKTINVDIPDSIKGNEEFETAFVKGAMTFESSVNINKSITFSVISKKFRDGVANLLSNKGVLIKKSKLNKSGNRKLQYVLRTSENINSKELEGWLDYYIKGSEKWFKILELACGFFWKNKKYGRRNKIF